MFVRTGLAREAPRRGRADDDRQLEGHEAPHAVCCDSWRTASRPGRVSSCHPVAVATSVCCGSARDRLPRNGISRYSRTFRTKVPLLNMESDSRRFGAAVSGGTRPPVTFHRPLGGLSGVQAQHQYEPSPQHEHFAQPPVAARHRQHSVPPHRVRPAERPRDLLWNQFDELEGGDPVPTSTAGRRTVRSIMRSLTTTCCASGSTYGRSTWTRRPWPSAW